MAQDSANALPVRGSFRSNRQRDPFFFEGCAAPLGEQQTPERPQIVQQSAARVHMILQLVQLVVHQMEGLQPTFRPVDACGVDVFLNVAPRFVNRPAKESDVLLCALHRRERKAVVLDRCGDWANLVRRSRQGTSNPGSVSD